SPHSITSSVWASSAGDASRPCANVLFTPTKTIEKCDACRRQQRYPFAQNGDFGTSRGQLFEKLEHFPCRRKVQGLIVPVEIHATEM
ncbi:MAG: hypothetical protein WAL09_22785, partial [Pseudolabrys sp.]